MFEKKNYVLNCDVCDTRKMKEEDYSHYEQIMINTDVVIVSNSSKSMLNHLPVTLNHDKMVEIADDVELFVKTVSGSYEITGETADVENTVLIVDGNLMIEPGTESFLKKYVEIVVNGSVKYPQSLSGYLNRMTINGSANVYPDDCVRLAPEFTIDKYFPLRAKEGRKYYAEQLVIIKDKEVDIAKLVSKNVRFVTSKLIVPESKVEDCAAIFNEQVEFIVVPDELELVYGDTTLGESLIAQNGPCLFVYGNVELDVNADISSLCNRIERLEVCGSVTLLEEQEATFRKLNAKYTELIITKDNLKIRNMPKVKIDKILFENAPEGIEVSNIAKIVIEKDVTPQMILEKLTVRNCALVSCSMEQESAMQAVSVNVGKIGRPFETENGLDDIGGIIRRLSNTKMVNADSFVM